MHKYGEHERRPCRRKHSPGGGLCWDQGALTPGAQQEEEEEEGVKM